MPKSFFVPGTPRPGGSKTAFYNKKTGRAMIVDAGGKPTKNWRDSVATAALEAGIEKLDGPVRLNLSFFFERPKSHYRSGKYSNELKTDAPKFKTSKPDTTKLIRSTEDALTGIAWHDDSQVIRQFAEKLYCDKDATPGCKVFISPEEDHDFKKETT